MPCSNLNTFNWIFFCTNKIHIILIVIMSVLFTNISDLLLFLSLPGSSFSTMSALIIAVVGATFLLILFIILYCRCNSHARESRSVRDDIPAPAPVCERQDQRAVIGVLGAPNRPYSPSAALTRPPATIPSAPARPPTRAPVPNPSAPVHALTLTPSAPTRPAASVRPPARLPVPRNSH